MPSKRGSRWRRLQYFLFLSSRQRQENEFGSSDYRWLAKGLGKAFSEAILKKGGKVCVADLDLQGQSTVDDFKTQFGHDKAIFVKCDVTNVAELRNVFEEAKKTFSRIDVVCNNAGILHETHWRKMIDINLLSVIQGTYFAREFMGKDRGGHGGVVVNVSSMAGILCVAESPAYAASKHGVLGFTRSYAKNVDYLNHGIRMNVLCPSFTDTDIVNTTTEQSMGKGDIEAYIKMVGLLSPSTVADAFMMLVEDKSQNGSVLTITQEKGISYKKYAHM